MITIEIDMFSDFDKEINPVFLCKNFNEMVKMIEFFTRNGYRVIVGTEADYD